MHTVTIMPDGSIRRIYSDDNEPIAGKRSIKRASHVEPRDDGRWQADMSPVGGPMLEPTETRQESLDLEVAWLRDHGY